MALPLLAFGFFALTSFGKKPAIRPHVFIRPYITSYGWKICQTGPLEFFMALPEKIFCLGLSSHSWPSGKFVYARYAGYTNSNALLQLRLSSINVFCPHFVRAKIGHLASNICQALDKY